jgi:RuvB-like protein 1 (pontin 52)
VSSVLIGLRTVKGTKQLKLDPTIYDSLQKERVQVRRVGRLGGEGGRCV